MSPEVEQAFVPVAVAQPAWGHVRVVNELRKQAQAGLHDLPRRRPVYLAPA